MQPLVYIPRPPLDAFVDLIWYAQADHFAVSGLSLPIPNHELIFNFSDHFVVRSSFHAEATKANARSWVAGLQTRPVQVETRGRHEAVGVLFKPWGLQPLAGMPASEFSDATSDSEAVWGGEIAQLTGSIEAAKSGLAKIQAVEAFLLRKYRGKAVPPYLTGAVRLLRGRALVAGAVGEASRQLGISPKTLIGAFHTYIGLSPKKFLHLQLVHEVRRMISRQPEDSLTGVAYRHGFFDQAHFIRLFSSVTGLTPSAYRHSVRTGRTEPAAADFIAAKG